MCFSVLCFFNTISPADPLRRLQQPFASLPICRGDIVPAMVYAVEPQALDETPFALSWRVLECRRLSG